jgi:hypothetical protein
MGKRTSLWILEKAMQFDTRLDVYVDVDGNESVMKWIPPFRACRALTANAAVATPSWTVGDWFHPEDIQAGWVNNTDYEIISMGGYWVDMYLCSSPTATSSALGSVCNGTDLNRKAYVSQPGVAPMVSQTIEHFRTYLKARFNYGGFAGAPAGTGWAGKGGLMTDAHWFDLWIWTRINRWLLRGNTYGYSASNHIPQWHLNANDIGILDTAQSASYGASITGGGGKFWDIPISDFCGNRWEFTDGLRLNVGAIYTAGKTVNPFTDPSDGYGHASFTNTGLSVSGCTSGQSVASYRAEAALKMHGIAASTVTAGTGGFDGQYFGFDMTLERIALRGGHCGSGVRCPGALGIADTPSLNSWFVGARAVLVP